MAFLLDQFRYYIQLQMEKPAERHAGWLETLERAQKLRDLERKYTDLEGRPPIVAQTAAIGYEQLSQRFGHKMYQRRPLEER